MNLRTSCCILLSLIIASSGAPLRAQENSNALDARHRGAVQAAQAAHQERRVALANRYAEYVDRLRAQAQEEGELDLTLALIDEVRSARTRQKPADAEAPANLRQGRDIFLQQLADLERGLQEELRRIDTQYVQALDQQIQESTRAGDIEAAKSVSETKRTVEERLAASAPPAPQPTPVPEKTEVQLGPNLLPGGTFNEDAPNWRLHIPQGERNRSEIYSEPNSNRNKALRIHQHSEIPIYAGQGIRVEAEKTYQITWRARLVRAWRPGIETRGKGSYAMGFVIPDHIFNAMPLAEQAKHRQRVDFSLHPPPSLEWQTYSRTLKAYPLMSAFVISASAGEGEFLIDDIEVREILPEKKEP